MDLFVRASNVVAIAMYHRLGYVIYRRVLGYYSGEEDAFGACRLGTVSAAGAQREESIVAEAARGWGDGRGRTGGVDELMPGLRRRAAPPRAHVHEQTCGRRCPAIQIRSQWYHCRTRCRRPRCRRRRQGS